MCCYAIPVSQESDAAGGPDSGGDESLADAFWSVARQLRETSQETLAPWDITPAQFRALRVLRRHGVLRLSELSDHLHIAARSTTEVIDALESRHLVARGPIPMTGGPPSSRSLSTARASSTRSAQRAGARQSAPSASSLPTTVPTSLASCASSGSDHPVDSFCSSRTEDLRVGPCRADADVMIRPGRTGRGS